MHPLDYIEDSEPKQIKRFEPVTKYDFCQVFASITGRPIGLFLRATKHYPLDWFFMIQSLCKEKDRVIQAKIINAFIRDAKLKEVDK